MQKEEFLTYLYNYKRQGLYPNHKILDLGSRINAYGTAAGVTLT
jgi:hypothetical protein